MAGEKNLPGLRQRAHVGNYPFSEALRRISSLHEPDYGRGGQMIPEPDRPIGVMLRLQGEASERVALHRIEAG